MLSREPDGRYSLTFADTSRWVFRPLDGSPGQGRIERIVDRHDNEIAFAYDAAGRLATIMDRLGLSGPSRA